MRRRRRSGCHRCRTYTAEPNLMVCEDGSDMLAEDGAQMIVE